MVLKKKTLTLILICLLCLLACRLQARDGRWIATPSYSLTWLSWWTPEGLFTAGFIEQANYDDGYHVIKAHIYRTRQGCVTSVTWGWNNGATIVVGER